MTMTFWIPITLAEIVYSIETNCAKRSVYQEAQPLHEIQLFHNNQSLQLIYFIHVRATAHDNVSDDSYLYHFKVVELNSGTLDNVYQKGDDRGMQLKNLPSEERFFLRVSNPVELIYSGGKFVDLFSFIPSINMIPKLVLDSRHGSKKIAITSAIISSIKVTCRVIYFDHFSQFCCCRNGSAKQKSLLPHATVTAKKTNKQNVARHVHFRACYATQSFVPAYVMKTVVAVLTERHQHDLVSASCSPE